MSAPPKILIVGSGNPCRNPRQAKEADALGHAGYDVTLITAEGDRTLAEVDAEMTRGAPYRHVAVGMGSSFQRFVRRMRTWAARKAVRRGFETVDALGPFSNLWWAVRRRSADLTIVHNEIPFVIGSRLIARGRRVAADIEDWYSEDLVASDRSYRPMKLLKQVESDIALHAAYKTTTSHALSRAFALRYGGEAPQVITNSFSLQPDPRRPLGGRVPAFFWFSQTLGEGRGLEEFRDAWIRTRNPSRLVLVGESLFGFREQFIASMPPDFQARTTVLPLVSPAELPSLIAQFDIGLALESPKITSRNLTITNKILQYMNAGLGLIASDTEGQREVLTRFPASGLLVSLHDVDGFARTLDQLLSSPDRIDAMGAQARAAAESAYSWEREAPRLIEMVRSIVGPSGIA